MPALRSGPAILARCRCRRELAGAFRINQLAFPIYRLFVIGVALRARCRPCGSWLERTRLVR